MAAGLYVLWGVEIALGGNYVVFIIVKSADKVFRYQTIDLRLYLLLQ